MSSPSDTEIWGRQGNHRMLVYLASLSPAEKSKCWLSVEHRPALDRWLRPLLRDPNLTQSDLRDTKSILFDVFGIFGDWPLYAFAEPTHQAGSIRTCLIDRNPKDP